MHRYYNAQDYYPQEHEEQGDVSDTLLAKFPLSQVTAVKLKYSKKDSFSNRFVWVDAESDKLSMSQFNTKDRKHKEAFISDISSIAIGAVSKIRAKDGDNKDSIDDNVDGKLSLAINFVKGGGVDMIFESTAKRDLWFNELNFMVNQFKTKKSVD